MTRKLPLAQRALTYDVVGATSAGGEMIGHPRGYRSFERTARIGQGAVHWEFASDAVLRWGVKTESGFAIREDTGRTAAGKPAFLDAKYWLIAHVGPFRIAEPVQVVSVVDQPNRKGFAYGTLAGHPISGEEAFLVDRHDDGSVWLTVRSISRPSAGLWRGVYPMLSLAQRYYRRRYVRALLSH